MRLRRLGLAPRLPVLLMLSVRAQPDLRTRTLRLPRSLLTVALSITRARCSTSCRGACWKLGQVLIPRSSAAGTVTVAIATPGICTTSSAQFITAAHTASKDRHDQPR
jgi:hypothetical protein